MNLYKLFILFFSYNFAVCFNTQKGYKCYTNLYMKRKTQGNANLYIPRTEKQKDYVKKLTTEFREKQKPMTLSEEDTKMLNRLKNPAILRSLLASMSN